MKFSIERIYEIAQEEYSSADFIPEGTYFYTWKEGVGNWAYYIVDEKENID